MSKGIVDHNTWATRADLAVARGLEGRAFIDGRLVSSLSEATFPAHSPIDGRFLADIAACEPADVDRAVSSARRAFVDRRWAGLDPSRRKAILLDFAAHIERHAEELALLETLDMGKSITDSLISDVPSTARAFRWYAEALDKVYGEVAPTPTSSMAFVTREPLGVVAAVVPWNFPMIMAAWKIAPALAVGNSVVLKPAEQSSLTAIRLAMLASESGFPDGVFNVVTGLGPIVGKALGTHMDVDGAFFTGSTTVGKKFLEYSGQSNMKKIGLECGGKSAHIILRDCSMLEEAARSAVEGIFYNQGEMCTAGSRLIVERPIKDRVLDYVIKLSDAFYPRDPLDPDCRLGALVDTHHTDTVMGYIHSGKEAGGRVLKGGNQVFPVEGGCYVEPTIFDNVTNTMTIARQEIFGPVLSVIEVDSAEEAVVVANDSEYGLAAAVWSDNVNTVHHVTRSLRAGVVYANCYDADDITVPFGGYRQSGIGRDKSLHAFDKYTEIKTTWLQLHGGVPR